MTTAFDPGAKFRIVGSEYLPAPGNCRTCGGSSRDCMDLGTDRWNGAILICTDCLRNLIDTWPDSGFTRIENLNALLKINENLNNQVSKIKEAKRRFRDATTAAMDDLDSYLLDDTVSPPAINLTRKKVEKSGDGAIKITKLPDIDPEFV